MLCSVFALSLPELVLGLLRCLEFVVELLTIFESSIESEVWVCVWYLLSELFALFGSSRVQWLSC